MSLHRRCLLPFLVLAFQAMAQETVTQETNAPSVKWYQINTTNFRILYPKGFDDQAQRVANTLETIREPEGKSMGAVPKKISIILQNQSSLSNGFVTMAPRRSEFYTMPSQNYNFIGTNDWLNTLAAHEYRHMVQFQRSITGFNKLLYYVFGQQATAGMAFAAAPQWFWEGDAVATETAFTPSGRGRIPNFDLLFRTNTLEGRTFNYHKQYLRSYKHNIPNYYVLGYNMISYLRKKTGDPEIWEKIAGRSWNVPFIPFAFSNAIKKNTGMHVTDLYNEMVQARKHDYEENLKGVEISSFSALNKRRSKAYTDFSFPQPLDDGRVVALKSGIGDIEQLVALSKDGKEEDRYVQGIINDAAMISGNGQRIVWNEYRYDPRWLVRTYSVVKGYDFKSGKSHVISHQSRYAAAAISPDGNRVATIETTTDYKIRIVVLDYNTGNVVLELPNPSNDLLAMPRWSADGKNIIALRTNAGGKTITSFDVAAGTFSDLIPVSQENVGYPVLFKNYILFNSPATGIDNIFAVNLDSKERFQVTSSKYGAYNPAVSKDGATLYYNDQSRDGLDVANIPFDPSTWKKLETVPVPPAPFYQHLVDEEGRPDLLQSVTNTNFKSGRYHRAKGMINPHSWGPYFVNSLTQLNVGVSSNDILSTTSVDLGYVYDFTEKAGGWRALFSYQGFYPIVDVSLGQADRTVHEGEITYLRKVASTWKPTTGDLTFAWTEKTVEAGLRVPLVTTTSKYVGNVSMANYWGYSYVTNFTNTIDGGGRLITDDSAQFFFRNYQDNGALIYNRVDISAYRLLKQSRRDINSKWGQAINIDYYSTPYKGTDYFGEQFSGYATLFFPGLFKHHSLWGYWGFQQASVPLVNLATGSGLDAYSFKNQIPLPRGQTIGRYQKFYSMSANYTLPIWYPDIAMGPVLNVQRIRANMFYDYGYGKSMYQIGNQPTTFTKTYTSVGGEVRFDINVMRFFPQFNVGFRYSYGITPSTTQFDFLIGAVNLY